MKFWLYAAEKVPQWESSDFSSLVWCWWIPKRQLKEESKANSCHRYHWPLKLYCSPVTRLLPKQVLKECEISGCCILPSYEWEGGRSAYWYLCWADTWHWPGQAQAYPSDKKIHENPTRSLTWGTLGDLVIDGEWKAQWQGNSAIRKKREEGILN